MQLRHYFRYVPPEAVYLYFSEEALFGKNKMPATTYELVCTLGKKQNTTLKACESARASRKLGKEAKRNSASNKLPDGMLKKTEALLQSFFKPHNRDLEQLIGRPVPISWG